MTVTQENSLLKAVAQKAREAKVFADVAVKSEGLECRAVGPDAAYRVTLEPGKNRVWVGLYSPDRWLSESIEADLMHTGDKMEELLEEELVELGWEAGPGPTGGTGGAGGSPIIEHFRDEAKQYVFRTAASPAPGETLDSPALAQKVATLLLGYEAAFRNLGDMKPEEE